MRNRTAGGLAAGWLRGRPTGGADPSNLPAVVGMMNRALRRPARSDGHLERVDDDLLAHVAIHRPADDPAAEEILHRGQVQPTLTGPDLLDVRRPYAVRRVGPKVAGDEV